MKKFKFTFLVLLAIASQVNAQIAKPMGINLDDHLLIKISDQSLYGPPDETAVGTPFLKEEFLTGDVYSVKGKFSGVPMRYNIYHDIFEFKQGNQTYILDPQPLIRKIESDGRTFVTGYFEQKGKKKQGFLIRLDSGEMTLLVKKLVGFREKQAPKALESSSTPARYSPMPDIFYYSINNGEIIKVESVKKLIESMPDRNEELTQFAKKEKISSVKEEKLRKLIQYYNTLKR